MCLDAMALQHLQQQSCQPFQRLAHSSEGSPPQTSDGHVTDPQPQKVRWHTAVLQPQCDKNAPAGHQAASTGASEIEDDPTQQMHSQSLCRCIPCTHADAIAAANSLQKTEPQRCITPEDAVHEDTKIAVHEGSNLCANRAQAEPTAAQALSTGVDKQTAGMKQPFPATVSCTASCTAASADSSGLAATAEPCC